MFVQAGDGYCLANMSSGMKNDFQACAQFTPGPGVGKSKECTYTKHLPTALKPCPWLWRMTGRAFMPSACLCQGRQSSEAYSRAQCST